MRIEDIKTEEDLVSYCAKFHTYKKRNSKKCEIEDICEKYKHEENMMSGMLEAIKQRIRKNKLKKLLS